MGAKPPVKLKEHECDVCHRSFQKASALKAHYKFLHIIPNEDSIETQEVSRRKAKGAGQIQSPKNVEPDEITTIMAPKSKQLRRIEFECPVCSKRFSVFFSAQKHIQKYHCVDDKGAEVQPNDPTLIKPNRIELCITCKQRTTPTVSHTCGTVPSVSIVPTEGRYRCLGCNDTFETMMVYEMHVKEKHNGDMQKLYFASQAECSAWKKELEAQIGTNFLILHRGKFLKTFRCSYQHIKDNGKIELCPSVIVVGDVGKEVQVSYYKDHSGHKCLEEPAEMYAKHSEPVNTAVGVNNESFIHFRRIMSRIVNEAPNVNEDTLELLIAKAVEMSAIVKKYENDRDSTTVNKSMNDDQISEVLEEESARGKRKMPPAVKDSKRAKTETPVPEEKEKSADTTTPQPKNLLQTIAKRRLQRNSAAQQNKTSKNSDVKENDSNALSPIKPFQSPPSFNDSYKNFVDQNFSKPSDTSKASTPKKVVKKKVIMRTKLGQYKPSLSPKSKSNTMSPKSSDSPKQVDTPKASPKSITPKTTPRSTPRMGPKSVMAQKIGPKSVITPKMGPKSVMTPKIGPKSVTTPKIGPKSVMKPKIGPKSVVTPKLTPKLAPKSVRKPDTPFPMKLKQSKTDFKYEVKEQENDCNILILKI